METRVYFVVPQPYTIGDEFPTWEEAVTAARSTIIPFNEIPGVSRAFAEIRVHRGTETGSVDEGVYREEVFLIDELQALADEIFAADRAEDFNTREEDG